MNSLQLRKQLLIAESELNRAQLQEDWQAMTDGVRSLADRAKSFGSMASAGAVLLTGLAALRHGKSQNGDAKPSWMKSLLKGAGLVSTFWLAFRSQRRDRKEKFTDE
jgi:hypothetical protein